MAHGKGSAKGKGSLPPAYNSDPSRLIPELIGLITSRDGIYATFQDRKTNQIRTEADVVRLMKIRRILACHPNLEEKVDGATVLEWAASYLDAEAVKAIGHHLQDDKGVLPKDKYAIFKAAIRCLPFNAPEEIRQSLETRFKAIVAKDLTVYRPPVLRLIELFENTPPHQKKDLPNKVGRILERKPALYFGGDSIVEWAIRARSSPNEEVIDQVADYFFHHPDIAAEEKEQVAKEAPRLLPDVLQSGVLKENFALAARLKDLFLAKITSSHEMIQAAIAPVVATIAPPLVLDVTSSAASPGLEQPDMMLNNRGFYYSNGARGHKLSRQPLP